MSTPKIDPSPGRGPAMSTRTTVTIACGTMILGMLLGAAVLNARHDWADVLLVCSVLFASTVVEHTRSRSAPK